MATSIYPRARISFRRLPPLLPVVSSEAALAASEEADMVSGIVSEGRVGAEPMAEQPLMAVRAAAEARTINI